MKAIIVLAALSVAKAIDSDTSLPMANAAQDGMRFPITGLGTRGPGYKLGQKEECWHWPQCCTKHHCPAVNATKEFIKLAVSQGLVARIDAGYPYGDNVKKGCPKNGSLQGGHISCDTMGIGKGIKESGAKRKDVFITIKVGYAGPMGKQDGQIKSVLEHMNIDYADLCLMHEPEVGPGTGSHGQYGDNHCAVNKDYDAHLCRLNTWKSMLDNWKAGRCKAVGVNNWNVTNLKEIEDAKLELPSVVQYKFHLHQSMASKIQSDLADYTKKNNIIFNGIAPLGVPDWVTFNHDGMKNTTLEEPKVHAIAEKVGKTPAQVMLRWIIQQGIATQPRSMNVTHMKENLDMFDWKLDAEDMEKLTNMPQCNTTRGNPYAKGDPNGGQRHGNVVGVTEHC